MENRKTKKEYFEDLRNMVIDCIENDAECEDMLAFIDNEMELLEKRKASAAKRAEKIAEFEAEVMNPFVAAGYGYVDDVIDPKYARIELIRSVEMHITKREDRPAKKHGNIPL